MLSDGLGLTRRAYARRAATEAHVRRSTGSHAFPSVCTTAAVPGGSTGLLHLITSRHPDPKPTTPNS